jgi:type I restriction enzyme M protein
VFFTRGSRTERIWYYDLTQVKVGKKSPMTLAHFGWGRRGEILDDAALPLTFLNDWHQIEGNKDKEFPSFAKLLGKRGTPAAESDFSWTIDVVERRATARNAMAPYLEEVETQKARALTLKEKISSLRKQGNDDEALLSPVREALFTAEKAARDAQAKTDAIDAAVYDLKAVNPRARVERDTRTSAEIIQCILHHGARIDNALRQLSALIEADDRI